MRKILLGLPLLLFSDMGVGQKSLVDIVPKQGKSIGAFIPKGWLCLDTAWGDFNSDGRKDVAIVIIDSIQEKIIMGTHRSLVILEGIEGGFKRSGYCDSAILCFSCGGVHGDPFEGIEFEKNKLLVYHYGGSAWKWTLNLDFQFRNHHWFLIGKTTDYFWSIQQCDRLNDFAGTVYQDSNFITGQYHVKRISDDCKLLVNKMGKAKVQPLIELHNFKISN